MPVASVKGYFIVYLNEIRHLCTKLCQAIAVVKVQVYIRGVMDEGFPGVLEVLAVGLISQGFRYGVG